MISMSVMGQRAIRLLRAHLFEHVQTLPMRFYDRYPVGRLVTRLTNDFEHLGEMFSSGLITMAGDVGKMVFFAGVLFWVEWRLALAAMLLSGCVTSSRTGSPHTAPPIAGQHANQKMTPRHWTR